MGFHPFEVTILHANLFFTASPSNNRGAGMQASEFPLVSDNINGQLTRYMRLGGVFAAMSNNGSPATSSNASYGANNGNQNSNTIPWRPFAAYFVRGLWYSTPADGTNNYRSGYIGSFVGGYGGSPSADLELEYGHDTNGSTVDFEPLYGHGNLTPWPQTVGFTTQFRDSSFINSDGTAVITKSSTAQTWARTMYMPPISYVLWNGNSADETITSGSVSVYVETRPSMQIAGQGSHSPYQSDGNVMGSSQSLGNTGAVIQPSTPSPAFTYPSNEFYPFEMFTVTGVRKLNTRAMSIHLAKIFDNGPTAYGWRFEEDGTDADGGTLKGVNAQLEYYWQRGSGQTAPAAWSGATTYTPGQMVVNSGLYYIATQTSLNQSPPNATYWHPINQPFSANQDQRVRNAAYFTINEEYYGFVVDTKCLIYSNKSSMFPLIFFDLIDVWTSSVAPRIAGVAVTGTSGSNKIFFLSEDGFLAKYDFTATNGTLALVQAAPTPASNEAYSSLVFDGTNTIYALYGTWEPDHRLTSTGVTTPRVGLVPYSISGNQWGTGSGLINTELNASPLIGRINGRHLREAFLLRDGRVAILCEDVTVTGGNTLNTMINLGSTNNCSWQLMVFDTSATATWNTSIIRPSTPLRATGTISQLSLSAGTLTVTVSNSFSNGDYVTFGGITDGSWLWLNNLTVKVVSPSGSAFTCAIASAIHSSPLGPTSVSAGRADRGLQYGGDVSTFWYRNVNAHMHDVKPNTLLIQPNWTCGQLYIANLNSAGGAGPPTVSSWVAAGQGSDKNINHADIVPSNTANTQGANPLDIRHAADSNATVGDRTIFWYNDRAPASIATASSNTTMRMYFAAPSFAWDGSATVSFWERNVVDGNGNISSWGKPLVASGTADYWTVGIMTTGTGGGETIPQWTFPTSFRSNYLGFVTISSGGLDVSGPSNAIGNIYGRRAGQTLAFVPTYWKWSGSAWVYADSSSDAKANPKSVPSTALTDVSIPDGLIVQYGTTGSSSYHAGEFYTYNLCYGNTKFLRNVRFPWAMFAGQTFLFTDDGSRPTPLTMAAARAISIYLVDTDLFSAPTINTVPQDPTPAGATVTTPSGGWNSLFTWPKLNGSNLPYNGPLQVVLNVNAFDQTTAIIPPSFVAGTATGAASWTVGSDTFVASASSSSFNYNPWGAFFGSPNMYWKSNVNSSGILEIDLGTGPAGSKIPVAYSFRPYYDSANTNNNSPKTWQLQGSHDNASWTTLDSQNVSSWSRGMTFTFSNSTAFRYYRMNITAAGSTAPPALGMFQLYTAAPASSCSFTDIGFFSYGDNVGGDGNFLRANQFARGLTFEVSTNSGSSYTTITPLWRAHQGYVFSFNRQTGVTNIRLTCQSGYNFGTANGSQGNTNSTTTAAFGPIYLFDYQTGAGQSVINAARLGDTTASNGTSARGSWDNNCLGIACDAVSISIDSGSANALQPQFLNTDGSAITATPTYNVGTNGIEQFAALQMWDFNPTAALKYKVHPFWGFVFFAGAGQHGGLATTTTQAGTNLAVTYHWGRRI